MKLKNFSKAKDTVTRTKQQFTEWEKNFTNQTFNRGLIPKMYKELNKLDIDKPYNLIFKMGCRSKQRIFNRAISIAEKHLRRC